MAEKQTKGSYAHHTHREFNERFDHKRVRSSDVVERSWLSNRVLEELPTVANDFAYARDPFIAKQMDDLGKTEAERREEAARQSRMVRKDRPHHNLKPPKQFARSIDARQFSREWLREQRGAAMEQARKHDEGAKQIDPPERERHRGREPSR
ncbi:MAG: hypothetical protein ACSHYC_21945 [Alphaproteobacteria bacterium]